jgi:hypothetical protein
VLHPLYYEVRYDNVNGKVNAAEKLRYIIYTVQFSFLLMGPSKGIFVGDMKHLEEESEIFNVVGVVVVVDGEPKDRVRLRVDISYLTGFPSARNEDGRRKGAGTFRRNQTKVIVTFRVGVFQLVEILDIIHTKLVEILSDIRGEKIRDVSLADLTVSLRRNQVIGFGNTKDFSQAKGRLVLLLIRGETA